MCVQEALGLHEVGKPVLCVRFSPDGHRLITAGKDRTLHLLEREKKSAASQGGAVFAKSASFAFSGDVLAVEWVDSDEFVLSVRGSHELHYLSAQSRQEILRTSLNAPGWTIVWSRSMCWTSKSAVMARASWR